MSRYRRTISFADEATQSTARSLPLKVPTGQLIVLDGLALEPCPMSRRSLRGGTSLLAFVIISRLEIRTICQSGVLRRSEQAALAAAREIDGTSPATAKLVAAYYGRTVRRLRRARKAFVVTALSSCRRSIHLMQLLCPR
jgi:hypothetical protein